MTNKEKFLALVSKDENNTMNFIDDRIQNRAQLRESRAVAFKVIDKLDDLNWSQKLLAEKMGVSPQQVNKIVSGKENLTLSTLCKLQEVLEIPLLATFHEKNTEKIIESIVMAITNAYKAPIKKIVSNEYNSTSVRASMKVVYNEEIAQNLNYTQTAIA